ncbi:MAG: hypothetical protein KAR07_04335 [Spirochaetes bacterium]|nr:hypothetical protein [Spirochaetota bacterium]
MRINIKSFVFLLLTFLILTAFSFNKDHTTHKKNLAKLSSKKPFFDVISQRDAYLTMLKMGYRSGRNNYWMNRNPHYTNIHLGSVILVENLTHHAKTSHYWVLEGLNPDGSIALLVAIHGNGDFVGAKYFKKDFKIKMATEGDVRKYFKKKIGLPIKFIKKVYLRERVGIPHVFGWKYLVETFSKIRISAKKIIYRTYSSYSYKKNKTYKIERFSHWENTRAAKKIFLINSIIRNNDKTMTDKNCPGFDSRIKVFEKQISKLNLRSYFLWGKPKKKYKLMWVLRVKK